MAKDRSVNSLPFDRAMVSPYSCSSNSTYRKNCDGSSSNAGGEREWEETRCPICMEHPYNAILLLCSSRDKGCRTFICGTSYRHSKISFSAPSDQFCKSSGASSLQSPQGRQTKLFCPLCRGSVSGWEVVQPARKFDSKIRACSLETCNFTGNYNELRNHARLEHPSRCPAEANPMRQSNWQMMEQQQDMEDVLANESDIEYDWEGFPGMNMHQRVFWSDGCFFDFPGRMTDMDDMFSSLTLSLFNLYSFSMDKELAGIG